MALPALVGILGNIKTAATKMGISAESIGNSLDRLAEGADKINKSVSLLGTSVPSISEKLGPSMGKLAGYNVELTNAIEILDSSLSINNKQLTKLTLENKVAGGNNKNLLKTLRQSVVTGSLNNKTLGDFSERIGSLRDTYQISTDNLVGAMAKFASDLDLAFFGVGQQFSEAAMRIEGKFGEGTAAMFEKFQKQLMSPDMLGQRLQFGIQGMTDIMMNPEATAEQVEQTGFQIIKTLNKQITEQRRAFEAQGFSQDQVLERLGQYFGSRELVTTVTALSKAAPKEIVPTAEKQDPFKNLETVYQKAIAPLQELGFKLVPIVTGIIEVISTLAQKSGLVELGKIIGDFLGKIGKSLNKFTTMVGNIDGPIKLVQKGLSFVAYYLDGFAKAFDFFVSFYAEYLDVMSNFWNAVVDIYDSLRGITRPITLFFLAIISPFKSLGTTLGSVGDALGLNSKFLKDVWHALTSLLGPLWSFVAWLTDEDAPDTTSQSIQDLTDVESQRLAEEQRVRMAAERDKAVEAARAALNYRTNSVLELQSNTLNKTMQEIIYGKNLQKELVGISEETLVAIQTLTGVMTQANRKVTAPMPP